MYYILCCTVIHSTILGKEKKHKEMEIDHNSSKNKTEPVTIKTPSYLFRQGLLRTSSETSL